ncbi:H-2 class I histocompatibility antigen, D-B alpha chain-like [Heteronotia binoei]|uniref:H-2 class I histocompatibility antigen, D-B alpha chain-like n=1 Tax=Heteronotia binoei TaxID=13085 RepID=UPI00292D8987|nr:H-2 class I histocompatibility antigen, D-B alpha chain-like [Heteronotia binoei]
MSAQASGSSSPHSLRYFYTAVSEPGSGLPQFITVGYVDDQPFIKYDSITRNVSLVPWMEKVVEYKADYWEWETQILQGTETSFRGKLVTLRDRFHQNDTGERGPCLTTVGGWNQRVPGTGAALGKLGDPRQDGWALCSLLPLLGGGERGAPPQSEGTSETPPPYCVSLAGLHTWQWMYGCEVGPDGRFTGGLYQFAYDGEDFITLDRETLTWTARVPQALDTKRCLEGEIQWAERTNFYLEETCVAWLRRHLGYGQESLLRTEAPMPRVARKEGHNGQETLFCQLYGFYPKGIEVTWMKDGEDRRPETLTGGVVPNSDGTYHTWLSIEVDPKERDRYRCRVGHDSLPEILDLAWEDPGPSWGLIVGVLVGVTLAALALGAGVALYWKRRSRPEGGYNGTPAFIPSQNIQPLKLLHDLIYGQGSSTPGPVPGRSLSLIGPAGEGAVKRFLRSVNVNLPPCRSPDWRGNHVKLRRPAAAEKAALPLPSSQLEAQTLAACGRAQAAGDGSARRLLTFPGILFLIGEKFPPRPIRALAPRVPPSRVRGKCVASPAGAEARLELRG